MEYISLLTSDKQVNEWLSEDVCAWLQGHNFNAEVIAKFKGIAN